MTGTNDMHVEVTAAQAPLYIAKDKNDKGRPIMVAYGTHYDKGDRFTVSMTYKASDADKGDGVVHADGGGKFYFLDDVPKPKLFVRFEDIAKAQKTAPKTGEQTYVVKADDTLSGIAQYFYKNGDETHYMKIFKANKHILKNPHDVMAGQKLVIPKL
jgi:LysM repeat protein